jgi:hypothetical protein
MTMGGANCYQQLRSVSPSWNVVFRIDNALSKIDSPDNSDAWSDPAYSGDIPGPAGKRYSPSPGLRMPIFDQTLESFWNRVWQIGRGRVRAVAGTPAPMISLSNPPGVYQLRKRSSVIASNSCHVFLGTVTKSPGPASIVLPSTTKLPWPSHATLAPNGHNTQPWFFRIGDRKIDILPDFSRRTPGVDPDDHHLYVSLDAAAETLSLASAARGAPGAVNFDPSGKGSVVFDFERARALSLPLLDAIALMRYEPTFRNGHHPTLGPIE